MKRLPACVALGAIVLGLHAMAQASEFDGKSLAEIKRDPRFVAVAVQLDYSDTDGVYRSGPRLTYTDQLGQHDGYLGLDIPSSAFVSSGPVAALAFDWIGYIRADRETCVFFDSQGSSLTMHTIDFDNPVIEGGLVPVWVDRRGLERFAEIYLDFYI